MPAAGTRCWSRWRTAAPRGCAGACAPGARTRSACTRGTWATRCWATRRTAARPAAPSAQLRAATLSGESLGCTQSFLCAGCLSTLRATAHGLNCIATGNNSSVCVGLSVTWYGVWGHKDRKGTPCIAVFSCVRHLAGSSGWHACSDPGLTHQRGLLRVSELPPSAPV